MPYGPWDEYFIHQMPRTLDHVTTDNQWFSDRCYFNLHSPDGGTMAVMGYGNDPNKGNAHGYAKLTLPDGRHIDVSAGRKVDGDRGDLFAGPLRLTCVEPLKLWKSELAPNGSGLSWDLEYRPRAPLWELKPIEIEYQGELVASMQHMQGPGIWKGWIEYDGGRINVDGWHGARDRTFGVRVAQKCDFWLWFSAQFEGRGLSGYLFEASDGEVLYMDGGVCNADGTFSEPFVRLDHEIKFDGDRKRVASAELLLVNASGEEFPVKLSTEHQETNVYYGMASPEAHNEGDYTWESWTSADPEVLERVELRSVSLDQLMRWEFDGQIGYGIFEPFSVGKGYDRYPNWSKHNFVMPA